MATKYVLVSGGVISGIGKGVIASSLGVLLKSIGLKVTAIKIDPYLNKDAGLLGPLEHGECFVLDDGGEVDLDLGNYERYLNIALKEDNNITLGKMFQKVLQREREGKYLGKTVQIVPHLTDWIQDWIERVAKIPVDSTCERPDVCIIELGGTVGDIESAPLIEALRCLRRRVGEKNFLHCHVSLVPVINTEQKTKPTQAAIRDVRSVGLSPDIIACRCTEPLKQPTTDKIAMYCQVDPAQVIAVHDVPSTYHVPLLLESQGLIPILKDVLHLDNPVNASLIESGAQTWKIWKNLTATQDKAFDTVKICLVGKYTALQDAYLSVRKSLEHASMRCARKLEITWLNSSDLESETERTDPAAYHQAWGSLCTSSGILVPGGFGKRGTEGMVAAARWAREEKVPYLGICLGMQIAVVEFCRNICGIPRAQSEEFVPEAEDKVIIYMPEVSKETAGASLRLGLKKTVFQDNSGFSKLRQLYEKEAPSTNGSPAASDPENTTATADGETISKPSPDQPLTISERHRHRYEVNPTYIQKLASHGLDFIGKDETGERMEILELKDHPWFVGVQYHPEYLSRVLRPSLPYLGFVAAAAGCLDEIMGGDNKHGMVNGA
ncbi:MAG: hypothetical protein Q9169_003929 [Polycauliona sp. 2 TL-2023]